MFRVLAAACLLSVLALAGCGLGTQATATPDTMALQLTGSVHGGQQPVAGARIYVFQAANRGYSQKSNDLIGSFLAAGNRASSTVTYDSTYGAYYATTDATGGFSITGDYVCSGTGPVYLLATQGNPGLGAGANNSALAEMAVLATSCSSSLPSTLSVGITEVSTVAAVYSLAGYMTAPNAVSSNGANSALSLTGIMHAAATGMALTNLATGTPLATTAAGGTVPVSQINLLADIVAACVNSAGPTSTPCMGLFSTATSDGTATGTQPTDTVTALLNIAHHPGLNVATLYGLASANGPYQPAPTTQPTDLTLSLGFTTSYTTAAVIPTTYGLNPNIPTVDANGNVILPGNVGAAGITFIKNYLGGFAGNSGASNYIYPNLWAIDANGFGWSANSPASTPTGNLFELASGGGITVYNGFPGYSSDAAISPSSNIYFASRTGNGIYSYTNTGTAAASYTGSNWTSIAFDRYGNFYSLTPGTNALQENIYTPFQGGGLSSPSFLALDASSSVWITNGTSTLSKFTCTATSTSLTSPTTCTAASPSTGYTGGGLNFNTSASPYVPVVMDGASNPFVPNYAGQSISQFSNAGVAISPATTGYATGCSSKGLAVDGAGNVWVTCDNSANTPTAKSLIEFVGLATPVATPILPSQLGVRP